MNCQIDSSFSNAMVLNWMMDGIPILYYGQEQSFSGAADPVSNYLKIICGRVKSLTCDPQKFNREPLWTSGYAQTDAYKLIQTLNQVSLDYFQLK